MRDFVKKKIKDAEDYLQVKIPEDIAEFIESLDSQEISFNGDEWIFYILTDKKDNPQDNFIIENSTNFRKAWKVHGTVIASNGVGDNLVLIPDKKTNELKDNIFISLHEYSEIRLFAEDIFSLQLYGPKDYFDSNDFYIKLIEGGKVIEGVQYSDTYKYDKEDETWGIGYGKKSMVDDWIDENRFEKSDIILAELEKLCNSEDEDLKIWGLNKLSDVYLKGFGQISPNTAKAVETCQKAIDLNSHKAYSNMAAAFFAGIGVDKNLNKALEYIEKAHEISKAPSEFEIMTNKKRQGLYSENIKFIKKAIKESQK